MRLSAYDVSKPPLGNVLKRSFLAPAQTISVIAAKDPVQNMDGC
jgi:hypothetical protein